MQVVNKSTLETCVLSSCSLELAVFSLAGFLVRQHIGMWKVCFAAGGPAVFRNSLKHKRSISPDGRVLGVQRGMWFWPSARLSCQCWPVTRTEHHMDCDNPLQL